MVAAVIAAQSSLTVVWPKAVDLTRNGDEVLALARALAPSLLVVENLDRLGDAEDCAGFPIGDPLRGLRSRLDRLRSEPTVALIGTVRSPKAGRRLLAGRPKLFDCSIQIPPADEGAARRYVEMRLQRPFDDQGGGEVGSALAGKTHAELEAIVDAAFDAALAGTADLPSGGAADAAAAVRAQVDAQRILAAAAEHQARPARANLDAPDFGEECAFEAWSLNHNPESDR